MAIKIYEKFAPRANPADGDYPHGSIKNESVPGAKDGTPLDAAWGNDYAGFDAALFAEAGIVPNGLPDTAVASQRVDALKATFDTYGTVSDIAVGKFKVGKLVAVTDRTNAVFFVQAGGTPNGFDIIDAGNGNTAVLVDTAFINCISLNAQTVVGVDNSPVFNLNKYDLYIPKGTSTFESGQITPANDYSLDGRMGTIKNIGLTTPLFFDDTAGGDTFTLKNVNLELSKNDVTPGNLAGGGVWLGLRNQPSKLWSRIEVENVNIHEAFRASINLQGSQHISIKNVHDTNSGLNTGNPVLFGYGAIFEDCTDIDVVDYSMRDAYGFGMHIVNSANFDGSNIAFDNLVFDGGTAIGLTITESDNVNIRNYNSRSDGDATEINASTNVSIENFTWTSTGTRRGLLMGDNGSGIDNRNVTLSNGFVNTTSGVYSAAINYAVDLTMNRVVFNAPISFLANDTRSKRIHWNNCNINDNINESYMKPYMNYKDTNFIDCTITKTSNIVEFTNVEINKVLGINEYIVVPLGAMGGLTEAFSFDIITSAYFTSSQKSQAGWKKYRVVFDKDGSGGITGVQVSLIDTWGALVGRYLELQVVGNELRAVNTSGVQVRGNYRAKGMI